MKHENNFTIDIAAVSDISAMIDKLIGEEAAFYRFTDEEAESFRRAVWERMGTRNAALFFHGGVFVANDTLNVGLRPHDRLTAIMTFAARTVRGGGSA